MGAYTIRMFGDPVLRQRSREVGELDGELARIVSTMYETMYDASGVGLAAPQVGVQKRLFTYDVGDGPGVIVNPAVVETAGEWAYEEGCLSVPGISVEIVRPKVVTIQGVDLDGHERVMVGDELLGRLFLHELDHLDGILFLDRVDKATRRQALKEIRERALVGAVRPPVDGEHRL